MDGLALPQVHAENPATVIATLPRAESNPKLAGDADNARRFLLPDQEYRHRRRCHSRCWAPACRPPYTATLHTKLLPKRRRDFCAECSVSGRWWTCGCSMARQVGRVSQLQPAECTRCFPCALTSSKNKVLGGARRLPQLGSSWMDEEVLDACMLIVVAADSPAV
jgi:hypothetical protein